MSVPTDQLTEDKLGSAIEKLIASPDLCAEMVEKARIIFPRIDQAPYDAANAIEDL